MRFKWVILIFLVCLLFGGFFFVGYQKYRLSIAPPLPQTPTGGVEVPENNENNTDTLLQNNPDLSFALDLIAEGKYTDSATRMKDSLKNITDPLARAYAEHIILSSYVSAVVTSKGKDAQSLDEALRIAETILGNEAIPASTRAITLDTLFRLIAKNIPDDVRKKVESIPSLQSFWKDANGDENLFRRNYLLYAVSLAPNTDLEMRLARWHAEAMYFSKQLPQSFSPEEREKYFEQSRKGFLKHFQKGLDLLAKDYRSQSISTTKSFIPESELNKAVAAEYYEKATGETPFGPVEDLYQKAFAAARTYYPPYEKTIQPHYDRFKNQVKE